VLGLWNSAARAWTGIMAEARIARVERLIDETEIDTTSFDQKKRKKGSGVFSVDNPGIPGGLAVPAEFGRLMPRRGTGPAIALDSAVILAAGDHVVGLVRIGIQGLKPDVRHCGVLPPPSAVEPPLDQNPAVVRVVGASPVERKVKVVGVSTSCRNHVPGVSSKPAVGVARVAVDLSGNPNPAVDVRFERQVAHQLVAQVLSESSVGPVCAAVRAPYDEDRKTARAGLGINECGRDCTIRATPALRVTSREEQE